MCDPFCNAGEHSPVVKSGNFSFVLKSLKISVYFWDHKLDRNVCLIGFNIATKPN